VKFSLTNYPPTMFLNVCLDNTFGMVEMEMAAAIVIGKAIIAGGWEEHGAEVALEDFSKGEQEIGFLNLLAGGWLSDSELGGHDTFLVTNGFVKRLKERCLTKSE
jgi:hypothetical protein